MDDRTRVRAVGALLLALSSAVQAADLKHFELPAGDARVMLIRFSEQAGLQLLFDFDQLTGQTTSRVVGDLEPEEALRRLVKGLPVEWAFVDERTLALTLKTPAPGSRSSAPRSRRNRAPPAGEGEPAPVVISARITPNTALSVGAPVLTFTAADIRQTGAATLPDFLKTLPQVWGGGPTDHTFLGREAQENPNQATGINLRAMDAGAALVLIDGVRLSPNGAAEFVDVSSLPLSAIERIEISTDGSSTRYGADAVSGVVNVITRQTVHGAEAFGMGGLASAGGFRQRQFGELIGRATDAGAESLSFEYFDRGALPAATRAQATSDLTRFGGSNFDTLFGSPGTIVSPTGQTWAVPAAPGGPAAPARPLQASELIAGTSNLYDRWAGVDVLPDQRRFSVLGNAHREMSDSLTVWGELLLSRRDTASASAPGYPLELSVPETNPYYVNPTGTPGRVSVAYGFGNLLGPVEGRTTTNMGMASAAARLRVSSWDLHAQASYAWQNVGERIENGVDASALAPCLAEADPGEAFDPFGAATQNEAIARRVQETLRYQSRTAEATLAITGEHAWGHDTILSIGAEYRHPTLYSSVFDSSMPAAIQDQLSRSVAATFLELRAALVPTVELSSAVRYEDSGTAHVVAPKFGVWWAFTDVLALRSTWGRAYRQPNLIDVVESSNVNTLFLLPDPKSASGASEVLLLTGGNADLRPERATTWTLGADVQFRSFSLSATYFDTVSQGRIYNPTLTLDALSNPAFDGAIARDPSALAQADACARGMFLGSANLCATAPIAAIVDIRLQNLDTLSTRGVDLIGRWKVDAGSSGRVDLGLNAAYGLGYEIRHGQADTLQDLLDTPDHPLHLRTRLSASWTRGGASVAVFANFTNGYRDVTVQPARRIASWTTLDAQIALKTGTADGWMAGMELALNIQNLADRTSPFVNNALGIGYDPENGDLTGRLVSLTLRKRW